VKSTYIEWHNDMKDHITLLGGYVLGAIVLCACAP